MRTLSASVACSVLAFLSLSQAHAAVSGLYNTGQVSNGGVDANWTVSGCRNSPTCSTPTGPSAYLIGNGSGWAGNTTTSSWISNDPSTFGGTGPFTYATGFTASSADKVLVSFMADDEAVFSLNGKVVFQGDTDPPYSPWGYWEKFTLSGFSSGHNVLTVWVPNNLQGSASIDDGPTGLQVRFSSAPEPATWAMMALGFACVAFMGSRARRNPISI